MSGLLNPFWSGVSCPVDPAVSPESLYLHTDFNNPAPTMYGTRTTAYTNSERTLTQYGSAARDTTNFKYGASAWSIPSTGTSFLNLPSIQVEDSALYTASEAMYECWFRATQVPGTYQSVIFSLRDKTVTAYSSPWQCALQVAYFSSGRIGAYVSESAANLTFESGGSWRMIALSSTGLVSLNTWHHVRVTIKSGWMFLWLDGQKIGTGCAVPSLTLGGRGYLYFGAMDEFGTYQFVGQIDGFKIIKSCPMDTTKNCFTLVDSEYNTTGTPLSFLGNFTTAFNGSDPRYREESIYQRAMNGISTPASTSTPANVKFGTYAYDNGALYFSGDSAMDFGSSDFLIDFHLKQSGYVGNQTWLCYRKNSTNNADIDEYAFRIYNDSSGNLVGFVNMGGGVFGEVTSIPASTWADGNWHHIGFERDGSSFRTLFDGAVHGTTSISGSVIVPPSPSTFTLGGMCPAQGVFQIWSAPTGLDAVRIVKKALFKGAYTVPTVAPHEFA